MARFGFLLTLCLLIPLVLLSLLQDPEPPEDRPDPSGLPAPAAPKPEKRPDSLDFVRVWRDWDLGRMDYILPPAGPERGVRVTYEEEFFDVVGSNAAEVEESLHAGAVELGKRSAGGEAALGLCVYRVAPSYRIGRAGGSCVLRAIEILVPTRIVLPRWIGTGPRDLRSRWDHYVGSIRGHELSHQAVAVRGANDLHRSLSALGPRPCDAIADEAKRLTRGILDATARRQDEYHDAVQRHGMWRAY